MRRVSSSVTIEARIDEVWPYVSQFKWWPEWGVSVIEVDSDVDRIAPGVMGRVRTPVGLWLPFEIDEVSEESFWSWSVAGIPATNHHIESQTNGTLVQFTAPWIVAPYSVVMTSSLARLKRRAENPRHFSDTG